MQNRSRIILALVVLITGIGFYFGSQIKFEADIEGYNLASEKELNDYQKIQKEFNIKPTKGGGTIVVLEKSNGWKTFEDYKLLNKVTDFWDKRSEVKAVYSLTNIEYPRKEFLIVKKPIFLSTKSKRKFDKRMSKMNKFKDIEGKFISDDKQYALIHLSTKEGKLKPTSQKEFEKLNVIKGGIKVHFLQYDLIEQELKSMMKNDALLMALVSIALILSSFYFLTKSLAGLLLIGSMIGFNLATTLLFMYAMGIPFTVHMVTIPCIVIVLSFTDIMHLMYYQRKLIDSSEDTLSLRANIIRRINVPMLITSLTNIIGFVVFLVLSENDHLFNFSMVSIVGVGIAYLSSRFIAIHAITKDRAFIKRKSHNRLNTIHQSIFSAIKKRKWTVQVGFIVLGIGLVFVLLSMFKIDTSESDLEAKSETQNEAASILQNHFFGKKQVEVLITFKDADIWNPENLKGVEKVEEEIIELFKPEFTNSPVLLAKRYHRYLRNGNYKAFTIPNGLSEKEEKELDIFNGVFGGQGIVATDRKSAKIVFGFANYGLEESRKKYATLDKILKQESNSNVNFKLSGKTYLSDESTYSFTWKIIFGLGIGIVFASLLTFIVVRSFKQSFGLLLVNLIPVIAALCLMLIAGIAVTPVTLFFLSILLGLCVDDSIYIITQNNKDEGGLHVFPIFVTSVVLALGFIALGLSNFVWIRPFAWIFAVGIGIAYIMDLFILPLFMDQNTKFDKNG